MVALWSAVAAAVLVGLASAPAGRQAAAANGSSRHGGGGGGSGGSGGGGSSERTFPSRRLALHGLPPPPCHPPEKKYGAGVYNDTLRAAPFYAQLPVVCNLTGRGGWAILFFETIDGGENFLPSSQPQPGSCRGTVGNKVCGCRADGGSVALACPRGNSTIISVDFASIGTPTGTCGNLSAGQCSGNSSEAGLYVATQCLGKSSCTLVADIAVGETVILLTSPLHPY